MLTARSSCPVTAFHINVLCFCDGSASGGAYFFARTSSNDDFIYDKLTPPRPDRRSEQKNENNTYI